MLYSSANLGNFQDPLAVASSATRVLMPLLTTEASKVTRTSKNLCSTYSIPSLRSKITPRRVCNVYPVICVDMLIKETKFKHCLQMLWLIFVIHSTCLRAENVMKILSLYIFMIFLFPEKYYDWIPALKQSKLIYELARNLTAISKYCFAHVTSELSTR